MLRRWSLTHHSTQWLKIKADESQKMAQYLGNSNEIMCALQRATKTTANV
jgi:hypothetical protein